MTKSINQYFDQVTNLQFDKGLPNYKQSLITKTEIDKLMVLPNQFFYITDMEALNNIYVHPNIEHVLGYTPDDFYELKMIYNIVHPNDETFVLAYTFKTIEYSRKSETQLKDKTNWVFSLTFRLMHKKGHYIWVERHVSCYRCDKLNNMVYAISFYSDVTHLKKNNLIDYNFIVDEDIPFDINNLLKKHQFPAFSKREIQIIHLIAEGLTARQIANQLFISLDTATTHRKNILHKANATNCAQLVKFAIKHGIRP